MKRIIIILIIVAIAGYFAYGYYQDEVKKKTAPAASETDRDGRFIRYGDGTVLDTGTGLMWAATDNGTGIDWVRAKKFCEDYRGSGYTDWRMPTQNELATLYDSRIIGMNGCNLTGLIALTKCSLWALETTYGAYFRFDGGLRGWAKRPFFSGSFRALPVRSNK